MQTTATNRIGSIIETAEGVKALHAARTAIAEADRHGSAIHRHAADLWTVTLAWGGAVTVTTMDAAEQKAIEQAIARAWNARTVDHRAPAVDPRLAMYA